MTLVQTANGTTGTGKQTATIAPSQVGSLILVFIGGTGIGDTIPAPTDDGGNTYTSLYGSSSTHYSCWCYWARNTQPSTLISWTPVGSNDSHTLIVREYSGMMRSANVADASTNMGSGTSATSLTTSATATTTEANELVVCSAVFNASSPGLSVGSGFGNFATNNFNGSSTQIMAVEDKTVSSTGSQTGTMTGSPAGTYDIGVGAFALPYSILGNVIKPLSSTGMSSGFASN